MAKVAGWSRKDAARVADPHLSIEDIRSAAWQELDEEFPWQEADPGCWPMLVETFLLSTDAGYVVARIQLPTKENAKPEPSLYRIDFTIDGEGELEFVGDPLQVAPRYVEKGTVNVVASKVMVGNDANTLLADLKANNPLFASLKDTPNTHFIVFDLTTIGKASQHAGAVKYVLSAAGLEKALPSLISKPIHITDGLDGHFMAGKQPKAIGTFLGAVRIQNDDGTITLRTVGTLWDQDFPEDVADIQEQAADIGASYEISYLEAEARRVTASLVEINKYEFSGGALLRKASAAHPETQLLIADLGTVLDVMDDLDAGRLLKAFESKVFTRADKLTYQQRTDLSDSDFALIQKVDGKKVRRFPIQDTAHRVNAWARLPQAKGLSEAERASVANSIMSRARSAGDDWAKPYKKVDGKWTKTSPTQGGRAMPQKYNGIPDEHEAIVDLLIVNKTAVLEATITELKAAKDKLEAEAKAAADTEADPKNEASKKALETAKLAAEAKVAELTVKAEKLEADLKVKADALDEIEHTKKLDATWTKLVADYGIPDTAAEREKRKDLLVQAAAGTLNTIEGWKQLTGGGTVSKAAPKSKLFAGADPTPDAEQVKAETARIYPHATAPVRYR